MQNIMESNASKSKDDSKQLLKQNSGWAIIALFLILMNAIKIHTLLLSLDQDSNLIVQLWKPSKDILFFTVPTFIEFCIITIWILSPQASEMKKMFRILSIIATIFYLIYSFFMLFLMGFQGVH
jgi:hypothetical protein